MKRFIFVMGLLVLLALPASAFAAHYYGKHTGYAMGNLYGASGWVVYQTNFANHSSSYCSSDPASYWSFGTVIYEDYDVGYTEEDGSSYLSDVAQLRDIGDLYCTQGNYWVDLYFGRYKRSYETCSCNNGGGDVCSLASNTNNCTDAIYFGSSTRGYTGP